MVLCPLYYILHLLLLIYFSRWPCVLSVGRSTQEARRGSEQQRDRVRSWLCWRINSNAVSKYGKQILTIMKICKAICYCCSVYEYVLIRQKKDTKVCKWIYWRYEISPIKCWCFWPFFLHLLSKASTGKKSFFGRCI